VSVTVLTPLQAADYLDAVLRKVKNIEVVGIAGPGDPFANSNETMETLRLVRERYPEMMLCVATNGIDLASHTEEAARLKVGHVTVTVNAVDPDIGRRIYEWARVDRRMYRGLDGAKKILERQVQGIKAAKEKGIVVKVNTVVIPGINDEHGGEVARYMAEIGVDILNCIPLYHVAGTAFEGIVPPSMEQMKTIRAEAGTHLPQMNHCGRCRADAAGLIGAKENDEIIAMLKEAGRPRKSPERPYVAVASMEGLLVNQHLGEATSVWIFGEKDGRADLVERRLTPAPGGGPERWRALTDLVSDCCAILVSGIGPQPEKVMECAGVKVIVMEGLAVEGIEAILAGREVPKMLLRTPGRCGIGQQCRGTGTGCG
jgi:nitrogen fixation protein NifB